MDIRLLDSTEAIPLVDGAYISQHRPLAQHSPEWFKFLASYKLWDFHLLGLFDAGDLLAWLPFCERRTDIGTVLMSNPLPAGYGGVLHRDSYPAADAYAPLLQAYVDYGLESGADLAVILSSPFRDDFTLYDAHFPADYRLEKLYQYLPGDLPPERFGDSKFRNNLARQLRRSEEAGVRVSFDDAPSDERVSQWHREILAPRLAEIDATPAPEQFFLLLGRHLARSGRLLFAQVEHDGRLVGGGFTLFGWCQDIFLRATTATAMSLGAGMFLDHLLIREGHRRGVEAVNFQSAPSRESSSYVYKRQWGCSEADTAYFVKVLRGKEKFIAAGRETVSAAFPMMFVLPFSAYED